MNKSIHIGDDFKKKRKVRRNKSGLVIHTPIKGMKNTEFSDLLNHNKAYTQLLLTYVKTPKALGLEGTNYSLHELMRVFKEYHIHVNKKEKVVIAKTKSEAIKISGIPLRDIALISRTSRSGKIKYLKCADREYRSVTNELQMH